MSPNNWDYSASIPAAALFSALYGTLTLIHLFQAVHYCTPFLWVLLTGSTWLTAAYIVRCFSIRHPFSSLLFDVQFVLVLISPLWINAFCYVVLGRLVGKFVKGGRLRGIGARWVAVLFVGADLLSFIIQLIGAILSINKKRSIFQMGLHIYTAGVAFQFIVILVFFFFARAFHHRVDDSKTIAQERKGINYTRLLYTLYVCLCLIMFRILFRIIEFSAGRGNYFSFVIATHEWFVYFFDAVPMLFAILSFNVVHPGLVLGRHLPENVEARGAELGTETK